MPTSTAFDQLSPSVQRWLYHQGWEGLRPIQELAIPLVNSADRDLLITAPTAGGKTEAAFLPLVSRIDQSTDRSGFAVLCVSPLKALINDQYQRLEPLCDQAHTRITPWHGDVSQSVKRRAWAEPEGVLIITPESLEAMFVTRSNELPARFQNLTCVVIDEFHAFIGRERGQQLLSLLSRVEELLDRQLPRIALSATIGDAKIALKALRPGGDFPGQHLHSDGAELDLHLALKTFAPALKAPVPFSNLAAEELYQRLRGDSHLVFANSRRTVEEISDQLRSMSERDHVPNEFLPHHGSLSKDERYVVEDRLRGGTKPTTAIATSTLELGIDIGAVNSVAQIGAPSSVSSLRQRLGRSGRRGDPARLRILVEGTGHTPTASPIDRAELQLVQAIATLTLLLDGFIEPPSKRQLHLSTLIQQVLSMIAYRGDITAAAAYRVLCRRGPWHHLSEQLFARVLRSMAEGDLIQQLNSGELVVGLTGERLVSNYEFYTAFQTPDEYRLIFNGRTLGTVPAVTPYSPGQLLIFGGRRWLVHAVDLQNSSIELKTARQGKTPKFDGEAAPVHATVRRKMLDILTATDHPRFCDSHSLKALTSARQYYGEVGLGSSPFVVSGRSLYWFVWESDAVISTIVLLLSEAGFEVGSVGPTIIVDNESSTESVLEHTASALTGIEIDDICELVNAKALGKFDRHLSSTLLQYAFAVDTTDLDSTRRYVSSLIRKMEV